MKITTAQLRKIIAEEVAAVVGGEDPQRFLHGFESGHPMDDEGYMVKSRMADLKEMAEEVCGLLEMGDQLPAWVQDLVASAHTDIEHVRDYLVGDEKLRNYDKDVAAPVPPMGESHNRKSKKLAEGHARITQAEFDAWKSGDWGFVSEHDGGFRSHRRSMDVIPADADRLTDYIIRNYEGMCADLGCSDVSDPVFKQYVSDQLAGKVQPMTLKAALAGL